MAPSHPIIHPSSGNLVGAGCNPAEAHSLGWMDQNACIVADSIAYTSKDPSALWRATIGGTVTPGDAVSLTFTFGSGLCSGAGCTVSYTAQGGDTTAIIAQKLTCAIANNASLFRLNGGSCASGVVVAPAAGYGGYAGGQHIGYTTTTGSVINLDWDSTISLKVTSTVGGAATETVTITNTGCGTACSNAWDNNPAFTFTRLPTDGAGTAIAPPAGSQLLAMYSQGANSAAPTTINTVYGVINNLVVNSTSGALSGRWLIGTPDVSGNINQGIYVGAGLYTVGVTDKGLDTINAKQLWTNGNYKIYDNSTQWTFDSTGNNAPIIFNAGTGGMGVAMTPTGRFDVNGAVSSLGAGQPPTTGQGVTLLGGATPALQAFNWGTSTYLPLSNLALSWDFKPSNSSTSGVSISANLFQPDADNVTALGGTSNRWSNGYITNLISTTVTSPTIAGGSGAASTLTLESTSGAGTTDAILFKTASQTDRGRITTGGLWWINTTGGDASSRVTIEDGTGNNQLKLRYTGKTGVAFNQLSNGNFQFNLQDAGNFTVFTNNGSGAELQLYGTGGASIGTTPVDVGANNLYVQGSLSLATSTQPGAGAILANASIKSQGATAGIGYATGAGGAQTQATSRTTGVTLNTVSGDITLVSAAGSTSFQKFTVTNSAVAATDTIHVVQKSGTDRYQIFVTAVGAGSFDISFATISGTTTEQPVFHFNVIKGVNAWLLERDLEPAANDNDPAFLEKAA